MIAAWQQGARQYGVGSGGSGHVTGFCTAHQALEQQLAEWLGYPRALLFISGYAANQALLAALMQAGSHSGRSSQPRFAAGSGQPVASAVAPFSS